MSSAFLILDLIGRNAGLKCEPNARGSIQPEFNDREEAVGQLALPLINFCLRLQKLKTRDSIFIHGDDFTVENGRSQL